MDDRMEGQIREAQARGAFDGLPGAGKPLPGLVSREADVRERVEHFDDAVRDGYRRPVVSGPPLTVGLLDVEAVVADWWRDREERAAAARARAGERVAATADRGSPPWWRRVVRRGSVRRRG